LAGRGMPVEAGQVFPRLEVLTGEGVVVWKAWRETEEVRSVSEAVWRERVPVVLGKELRSGWEAGSEAVERQMAVEFFEQVEKVAFEVWAKAG
jgi:hypothetical protein